MINTIRQILGLGPKADLGQMIADGAIILDVRSKGEYSSGSARGAINIPLDQLSSNLKKLKDKDKPIITCCASGMRSASAKGILQAAGYKNVHNGGSWIKVQRYVHNIKK